MPFQPNLDSTLKMFFQRVINLFSYETVEKKINVMNPHPKEYLPDPRYIFCLPTVLSSLFLLAQSRSSFSLP